MRIIAGKNKSRKLLTLDGLDTRPMTDRMKESLFNTIGPYFDGDIVLDLFGGSGALSLEALSRGCKFSYIVEKSYQAINIIRKNVTDLKELDNTLLLNMDYKQALNKFVNDKIKFDIVFLDPPYKLNIMKDLVDFLLSNDLINDHGIIACQYVSGNYEPVENRLKVVKNNNYGISELCIYQYLK